MNQKFILFGLKYQLLCGFIGGILLSSCSTPPPNNDFPASLDLPASHIAVGAYHSCGIFEGRVFCWGDNSYGQTSRSTAECKSNPCTPVPAAVRGLDGNATAVALGNTFSCALIGDQVKCWGGLQKNRYGKPMETAQITVPKDLDHGVTRIRAGRDLLAAVVGEKNPKLFLHDIAKKETRLLHKGRVKDFGLGNGFGCFIARGLVQCWGRNRLGQLGNGTREDTLLPTTVVGLPGNATDLAVGGSQACAVVKNQVWCWGQALEKRGDASAYPKKCRTTDEGVTYCHRAPVQIKTITTRITKIGSGERNFCAISDKGSLLCWGADQMTLPEDGRLANIPGLTHGATEVGSGTGHTCAILEKRIKCWGLNSFGELGNGTSENSVFPVDLSALQP